MRCCFSATAEKGKFRLDVQQAKRNSMYQFHLCSPLLPHTYPISKISCYYCLLEIVDQISFCKFPLCFYLCSSLLLLALGLFPSLCTISRAWSPCAKHVTCMIREALCGGDFHLCSPFGTRRTILLCLPAVGAKWPALATHWL